MSEQLVNTVATPDPNKRGFDQVEPSPTSELPPAARPRSMEEFDFAETIVTALTDSRVTATLENILLKTLLTRIQEKEKIITQLTSQVNNLKKQVDDLTQSSSHQRDALDEHEQYYRRNSLRI